VLRVDPAAQQIWFEVPDGQLMSETAQRLDVQQRSRISGRCSTCSDREGNAQSPVSFSPQSMDSGSMPEASTRFRYSGSSIREQSIVSIGSTGSFVPSAGSASVAVASSGSAEGAADVSSVVRDVLVSPETPLAPATTTLDEQVKLAAKSDPHIRQRMKEFRRLQVGRIPVVAEGVCAIRTSYGKPSSQEQCRALVREATNRALAQWIGSTRALAP